MTNKLAQISNSDFVTEIVEYFEYRSAQLALLGYDFDYNFNNNGYLIDVSSVVVRYIRHDKYFYSIYVRKSHQGQNVYMKKLAELRNYAKYNHNFRIVTFDECNITKFLEHKNIPHVSHHVPAAFKVIELVYGDTTSKRNSIPYIDHIVKGLLMYQRVYGSTADFNTSMQVYCLHPIYQVDDLRKYTDLVEETCSTNVCTLAYDYRLTANSYLSKDFKSHLDNITLSNHVGVNRALLIDKLQNFSSLINNFGNTHPNNEQLRGYFDNWLNLFSLKFNIEIKFLHQILHEETRGHHVVPQTI